MCLEHEQQEHKSRYKNTKPVIIIIKKKKKKTHKLATDPRQTPKKTRILYAKSQAL